jgi:YVTN family beta-propeller protein
MSKTGADAIVSDYFSRLRKALAPLPRTRRDQLMDDLMDHVTTARAGLIHESEASVREILDHLGAPEDIAAEALAAEALPADFLSFGLRRRGSALLTRRYAILSLAALLGLTTGATLGVVLAGSSTSVEAETVAPAVNVGGFPTGLGVDVATGTVYVADGEANALSMINGNTCNASTMTGCSSSTASVSTLGQDPIGVVVDEQTRTVYAVNAGSDTVAVINARTCNALDRRGCGAKPALVNVPGGPEFLALDSATNTIYVADSNSGMVSVINGNTCSAQTPNGCQKAPASVNAGPGAFPIAVDQLTNTVYVGTNSGVAVINGRTCDSADTRGCSAQPATLPLGNEPAGVAVDDADHTVYVSGEDGTVGVINAATCNGTDTAGCSDSPRTVSVGSDPRGDAYDPSTGTIYVTNSGSNTVSLLNASSCGASVAAGCSAVPRSFPVGSSPRRIAIDAASGTVYVVNTAGNTVSVIRARSCNATDVQGCPKQGAVDPAGAPGDPVATGSMSGPAVDSDCSPTTDAAASGGPASTLTGRSTEVASGTVAGHSWSLWSAKGQTGANGLEDGGLVIDGHAYGLCPGFPNPAELEMADLGPNAIVYGVVGYPGLAKVDLYRSTVGTFSRGKALPSPAVRVVNGVSFFIGTLGQSACDYPSLELNTTSANVSAEHNLGFGSCVAGKIVPITASQGIWQLPAGQFPDNFGLPGGAASGPAVDSDCSPTTDAAASGGPASTLTGRSTEVASGTVAGHSWSLWSAKGQTGANGLEDGGLVIDGHAYGLCPGFPNPAELEMADLGPDAIVYGVVGYPGLAKVDLYTGTVGSFATGTALPSPAVRVVNGVSFFIGVLPRSACDYRSLELNSAAKGASSQHNLGFGSCAAGKIVPITASMGSWSI